MTWPPDLDSLGRQQRAVDALKIQDAITKLATRYDPKLVMEMARGWLAYMDAQVRHNDGPECDG
jgi:hypothetical protein